ncbi:hypothetical protein [Clostridium tetani]|uniref:hypothetical protein n=1 Tax=Clostridium tetani TaxID=1513 RepID=UPI002955C7FD|nr:hypothetical protein [Clostridium tetani]BDR65758.1 hypothetical protein K134307016_p10690 [Clostridium tetani]
MDENLTENQKLVIKNLFTEKYNEKIKGNRINLEASKRWDPTTIGLPPLKVTSGHTYLGCVLGNVEVQKKSNDQILLLGTATTGVAGLLYKIAPIVGAVVGGITAVIAGHQYYLKTLPDNIITYSNQYFRWTNTRNYEYEYKYYSGFKDRAGNVLSSNIYYSYGDFSYLAD